MSKFIYIVVGYDFTTPEAYTTKELAEEARKKIQKSLDCSGRNTIVYVDELELIGE